ncbi:hypothetical protein D7Y24_02865 [Stenotrophomonas maltophilia]|uniref:hypothetical protein n=1 Tax=Stenotrophomonas maltophilia TaxID=40324 RepID=UPI0015DEFCA1|nr:hypothetical protein [Stenotrophomonas maltophilia]ELN2583048.1 hypothetical protein [Stenotrophomonas maltophilia]ELN2591310.1 hypothetical protein [Stenotrophomonas maltophilia]MBA0297362.1 hypothetical protein [Stenotrophomonas maltophilia]MBH1399467.1 hypothetical protein [Stenotrophomonas maltophilia]MBH1701772.1 hypothetical protein [Stenotrophomonas maltophilia]
MHRPGTDPASPRVLRVESMSLDCGGTAVVVELDRTPERLWMKSLKRAVQANTALEGAQAKFDGRFVYFVGIEESGNRVQHHVMQALISAEPGRDPARPKGFPGAALSSSMTA